MPTPRTIRFRLQATTGSPQNGGKDYALALRAIPGMVEHFGTPGPGASWRKTRQFEHWLRKLDPIAWQEIEGFAEGWNIEPHQLLYPQKSWLLPAQRTVEGGAGCTQVAVPAQAAEGNVPFLARNYDFSDEMDDLCLIQTGIDGTPRHLGFACMLFGRSDGMNDAGLAVSMSSATVPPMGNGPMLRSPEAEGFQFWAVLRILLDRCGSCNDAERMLAEIPVGYDLNLLCVDRCGVALLAVFRAGRPTFKMSRTEPLIAANHVAIPRRVHGATNTVRHSATRYHAVKAAISQSPVKSATAKKLLTTPYPAGVECRFYDSYFGTLHSAVYYPSTGQAEIRFGADGPWHAFGVATPLPVSWLEVTIDSTNEPPDFSTPVSLRG